MMADEGHIYDLYLSYALADEGWVVSWLLPRLQEEQIDICTADDFNIGVPNLVNAERAIAASRYTLLVLSPDWFADNWRRFDGLLTQSGDITAQEWRTLPLLLRECDLPKSIDLLNRTDFTRPERRETELTRVLRDLRGEARLPNVAQPTTQYKPRAESKLQASSKILPQEQRNRTNMLQLVRTTWIEGVLEQSLHEAALLELGLEQDTSAVSHPWDTLIERPGEKRRLLPPGTHIINIFEQLAGKLLILGEPGSGKTTTLLELARDLIARAEQHEAQPIPVVFNLSSWASEQKALREWLIDELRLRYQVPKKTATKWIAEDGILPLLDGLDEVREDVRDTCLAKINAFQQQHMVSLVVCSRTEEYEQLQSRLQAQGAVIIQPLTRAHIEVYLAQAGAQLIGLAAALERDTALQELAQTPLMLSIMTLAYQGVPADQIAGASGEEGRRSQLFTTYTERMFKHRKAKGACSQEQTTCYLAWLAQQLTQDQQSIFYLEALQGGWLRKRAHRTVFKLVNRLFLGLTIAVFLGLVFGLILGLSGLVLGLFTGLFLGREGLRYNDLSGILDDQIKSTERLIWNKNSMLRGLFNGIGAGLALGLFGTLNYGLGAGLIIGFVGGLGAGLMLGLVGGLKSEEHIAARSRPRQGIARSARNASRFGIATGAGIVLLVAIIRGVRLFIPVAPKPSGLSWLQEFDTIVAQSPLDTPLGWGLFAGLFALLGAWLLFGGRMVLLHHLLCRLLRREGSIPKDYVGFLDHCTSLIFLRRVGGGYIFIHRMLMEHFASLWKEQPGSKERP